MAVQPTPTNFVPDAPAQHATAPRRTHLAAALLAFALLLLSFAHPSAAYAQEEPPADPYIPGRLIVGLEGGAAPTAAGVPPALSSGLQSELSSAAWQAMDLQVVTADDPCIDNSSLSAAAGQTVVQAWQVAPGQEEQAIDLLRQQPGVAFVVRDVYVYAAQDALQPSADDAAGVADEMAFSVNDPLYALYQWAPQRAGYPRAWQLLANQPALSSVRVAVIDSGVDFNHPDLAGRLLPGKNYIVEGAAPNDDNGHGTHVAGIIAAATNNGIGIAGSAPNVLIDPLKVLNSSGGGSGLDLRYALCDAARRGDRIINMSLQIPPSSMPPGTSLYTLIYEAIQFADARGVLLVAAGGNYGQVYYPALFDEVMAVSALTIDNVLASYSARGPQIEIAAPGGSFTERVLSTWSADANALRLCPSDLRVQSGGAWYCAESGTSMAAPYVAGAAAVALNLRPSLSAGQVRSLLKTTAQDVGLLPSEQGAGLLDAERLVRSLVRSGLQATPDGISHFVAPGSAPFTTTIVLSNPSLDPLSLSGTVIGAGSWFTVTNTAGITFSGSLRHGQPLALTVAVSPTALTPGVYSGQIKLNATRSDGSTFVKTLVVFANVGETRAPLYLPFVLVDAAPQQSAAPAPGFTWETPISPTLYALSDTLSVEVPLPFDFPFAGSPTAPPRVYSSTRLYADGFIAFADASFFGLSNPGQNRCLPLLKGGVTQAVFGWWADLDAGAAGAEVATFRPAGGPDRFVFQYTDVASVGVTPAYKVTFQIVLYANGEVRVNYLDVPPAQAAGLSDLQPFVTVGAQAANGLYRNQVVCYTPSERLGTLPQPNQSLRLQSGDTY